MAVLSIRYCASVTQICSPSKSIAPLSYSRLPSWVSVATAILVPLPLKTIKWAKPAPSDRSVPLMMIVLAMLYLVVEAMY